MVFNSNVLIHHLAIKQLNNNKSARPDGTKAEFIKISESDLTDAVHKIICNVWLKEKLPVEWDNGFICPIFKKGNKVECINYRGITLLNITFKIFFNVLLSRLLSTVTKITGKYQCRFQ